jgi:parallel beta-helix repeat protein
MSKIQKWVFGILVGLVALIVAAVLVMGFWPVPADVAPKPAESLIGAPANAPTTRPVESSQTYTVKPGDSIQAAVDGAKPGDTIEIMAGTYHEAVQVKTHNLTVRGLPDASGNLPVLDGEDKLDNGFKVTGSFFTVEKLSIRNYTENGVIAQGTYGPVFRDLVVDKTGRYAVFPIASTNVLIEGVTASGIADSALYVGQSKDIIVRNSEAFKSVTGIEIENSDNALVENNYIHDNTGGILVFVSPHLNSKEGHDNIVRNNRVENNNLPNFATGGLVQKVPPGVGMIILTADNTEIAGNTISGNNSAGIAIVEASTFEDDTSDYDIPLVPEGTWVHGNTFTNNGTQLSAPAAKFGLPGGNDILWDASAWNNTFDQPGAKVFPYAPGPGWPDFLKKAVWRAVQVLK